MAHGCDREELTPCWIYFFHFHFSSHCFYLLKGYCLHVMACLGDPCPSAWILNPSAFVQDSGHLWMAAGIQSPRLAIQGDICKINGLFYFTSSPLPSLFYKRPGTQTPIRWLFWDISLLSSQTADFLNKVIFLALAPCLRLTGLG